MEKCANQVMHCFLVALRELILKSTHSIIFLQRFPLAVPLCRREKTFPVNASDSSFAIPFD